MGSTDPEHNNNGNCYLTFKLSTKHILVTIKYQPIHTPEDIIKATNEEDLFNNKIQINHFDSDHFILQDGYSDKCEDDGQTHFNNENNSEDKGYDELESNKTIDQEDQFLLAEGSNNSINVSTTGLTSTSIYLQDLFYSIYTKP